MKTLKSSKIGSSGLRTDILFGFLIYIQILFPDHFIPSLPQPNPKALLLPGSLPFLTTPPYPSRYSHKYIHPSPPKPTLPPLLPISVNYPFIPSVVQAINLIITQHLFLSPSICPPSQNPFIPHAPLYNLSNPPISSIITLHHSPSHLTSFN